MNSRRTFKSREHSLTFEPYDLVEFSEEEEREARRGVLRTAARAAASEARNWRNRLEDREERYQKFLKKGLNDRAAQLAAHHQVFEKVHYDKTVYGRRYVSLPEILGRPARPDDA